MAPWKYVAVALLCLALFAGCGGGGSSNSSGSNDGYSLILDIVPDRINIEGGGSAVVRVSLFLDGAPSQGSVVTLTTTFGKLGASSLTTGADGTAVTTLSPANTTDVGNATVTATFGTIIVYSGLIEFYNIL